MKKIMAAACALCFAAGASAQTIYDATKLAERDLNGTARFVGMGGAMGALGGDISTMGTNPAGIGIYRSNDVMTSFSFSSYGTESKYGDQTFNNDKGRWSFDNIGFVFSSKIGNQTPVRYVNFGFNYKRTKSFYKNMTMGGLLGSFDNIFVSQVNQMAQQATDVVTYSGNHDFGASDIYNNNQVGWLGAIGYNGFLTNSSMDGDGLETFHPVVPDEVDAYFNSNEKGGINQFDFNIALNVDDRAYFGLTIGAYDVDYKKTSLYDEDYGNGEGYGLTSFNRIKGSGVDVKFGAIVRPFEYSPLRIGLAIHTPTFYNLTYENGASLAADVFEKTVQDGDNTITEREEGTLATGATTVREEPEINGGRTIQQNFRLSTPWLFNVSLGYTVGSQLALGAEYEYENYSTMKFSYPEGDKMTDENSTIKDFLKGVHTFRIGAEYKVIPEFAFRLGYNYSSTAFKDEAYKWIPVNSTLTDTDFANSQSQNNYTIGIGYRGSAFYADLAYQYSTYKENFYPFYNDILDSNNTWNVVTPQATKVTNTRSQVLLTLGFRF